MHHLIRSEVVVPVVWNDRDNQWEVDPSLRLSTPLKWELSTEHETCPCQDQRLSGETSQQHDEQWGRAVDAEAPSLLDFSFYLRGVPL